MTSPGNRPPGDRGREAEALAERYLAGLGYRTLARNHATRRGEVDLVCRDGEVICFVEVRSRSSAAQGSPLETVGIAKARRVVAAATDWARRNGALEQPLRFDVVGVLLDRHEPRFELVRGAFDASGRPCP
jgi:putative endonuclease